MEMSANLREAFESVVWVEDGPYPLGKFESLRDEYLYGLWVEGWACESSGEVDAPVGVFCLIGNAPEDVFEMSGAFGAPVRGVVGWFVGRGSSQGFVWFEAYATEAEARGAYEDLEEDYSGWLGDDVD